MDLSNLAVLISALGGLQVVLQATQWWSTRRAAAREAGAKAQGAVDDIMRKQIDWLEARLKERDIKIDSIYSELRAEQAAHMETINKLHEVELHYKELEIKKCIIHGCKDRKPPSDY